MEVKTLWAASSQRNIYMRGGLAERYRLTPLLRHFLLPAPRPPTKMEPHQNADYFLSSFRDFASYQNPEEVAPTPTTNRWEGMELNENGWDTQPPIPHFIEVPQVPQIPTLYAPPETSSPYPGQQLVSIPELGCRTYRANHWR